ncbi:MAG: hypothetical protein C0616_00305 [Desulfuromonas sp.]|nr:MAG: hypothetical protein C0616_00305 [Desulfuromonas sp.]
MLQGVPGEFKNRISYYGVDSALNIEGKSLESVLAEDLIVLIDYFGWPAPRDLIVELQRKGAVVLEDACQVLPGALNTPADFLLFSPRKYFGVPDGAILISREEINVGCWDMQPVPHDWWSKSLRASILRHDFDLGTSSREWFELFQQCELNPPIGPFRMSELSRSFLTYAFDPIRIAAKRKENYSRLYKEFSEFAVLGPLPDSVVPLGFPMCVPNRPHVLERLFAEEIYPAVHWPITGVVPEEFRSSHNLSTQIMTLPCDQRYEDGDIARMIAALHAFL